MDDTSGMSCSITTSEAPISSRSLISSGASDSTSRWAMPLDGSSSRITVGRWATRHARSTTRRVPVDSSRTNADRYAPRCISSTSSSTRSAARSSSSNTIGNRIAAAIALRCRYQRSSDTASVSVTVISGYRRASWKLRPSPRLARDHGARGVMSTPPKLTAPAIAGAKPLTRSNSVVLPAPLGPIRPRISPGARANDTLSTARMPPYEHDRSVTASAATSPSA